MSPTTYISSAARLGAGVAGHGACGPSPWINPFSATGLVESFHPTRDGYRKGYLPLLDSVTG
jgi:hypothetical protein